MILLDIFIAILPALLWGAGPLLATLVGGKPIQQVTGTCYGQFVIGVVLYLVYGMIFGMPAITFKLLFWPLLGGILWAVAQLMQFTSFKQLSVSIAMPISTGLQVIEIPLLGVIFWGEWYMPHAKLYGFISIAVLIIGICLTSYKQNASSNKKLDYKGGLTMLIVGSFGYTACSIFPKISDAHTFSQTIVLCLGQNIGMCLGAAVMAAFIQHKAHFNVLTAKVSFKNMIVGLLGGIGILCYLYALSKLGPATAFPLTQMNVLVSTLGGIFILHEHKTYKEMAFILIGLVLILGAATVIAQLK
ncbi:ribose uptake protein RbsU [Acetilactobacillus jinshanensis]|uniref:Ribose uptake protein RbsU n=1 Tax=Acetilactobacillus jinshanensis TaxID=1720083 RepID=A0A4P6ZJZ8_9LACO|nr:ribose uptake protein RbsU [Acetilactobacillus jinshanensis]